VSPKPVIPIETGGVKQTSRPEKKIRKKQSPGRCIAKEIREQRVARASRVSRVSNVAFPETGEARAGKRRE
jgi:hypothetical protein